MKNKLLFLGTAIVLVFAAQTNIASATKSPAPRITEVVGTAYASGHPQVRSVRVHFQFLPAKNGQIIKVKYMLKGKKYTDVNYKPPKSANRSGQINVACSAHGSAIDLKDIIDNNVAPNKRFVYDVKVRIQQPGKSWSSWSSYFSL